MKITGKEWQSFLDSWPEGWWYDDSDELVDGKEWDGGRLQGTETVTVSCGVIFKGHGLDGESADLLAAFRKWRKAQDYQTVVLEVPRTVDLHYFDVRLREIFGAKVVKHDR